MTGRVELFRDTVLRRGPGGAVYLMNHPEKGWASYAIPVSSEADAEARFAIEVGPWAEDEHGPVAPARRVSP